MNQKERTRLVREERMTAKMIIRFVVLFVGSISLIFIVGCAPKSAVKGVSIGSEKNGQSITVKKGEVFTVKLESNITTGYSWAIAELDHTYLEAQGEPQYDTTNKDPNIAGAGGTETFTFKPVKSGQTSLKLVYSRPWEKGVDPTQTFTVQVTVE